MFTYLLFFLEMHSAVSQKQSGDSASVASSAALTGLSTESLSISASLSEAAGQDPLKRCVIFELIIMACVMYYDCMD